MNKRTPTERWLAAAGEKPLFDAAPTIEELADALQDIAAWAEKCIKLLQHGGNRNLASGLDIRVREAHSLLARINGVKS